MLFFVARRLLYLVPVLVAVSLLTFLIASLLPGDLAYVILGDQATPEKVAALRHDMGLDQPIWWRYLSWLGHVLQGDFGRSFRTGQTVLQAVTERLPVSLELMLLAEIMGLAIGVPLAIVCAALTLALAEWPGIMRVLRSDMIATLQEDYIALAKAKGLTASRILFVHALKPSSLTLVTITGINIGRLIGGTLIVETIFALPGIGRLLVAAIYTRDLIILQGVVLFVAGGFVMMNFVVDMLYSVLDPRIRHGHT